MKYLQFIIIILILGKTYSYTILKQETERNELTSEFIEYDLRYSQLDEVINHKWETIKDFSKTKDNWYEAAQELKTKLNISNEIGIGGLIDLFNSAELRKILNYSELTYEENPGLSKEHNRLIVIKSGYQIIKEAIVGNEFRMKEKPYLLGLERHKDSMDIVLGFGLYGDIEAQLVHKADTIDVYSLPVNIGEVKGDVTFLLTNQNNKEKRCYKKRF